MKKTYFKPLAVRVKLNVHDEVLEGTSIGGQSIVPVDSTTDSSNIDFGLDDTESTTFSVSDENADTNIGQQAKSYGLW